MFDIILRIEKNVVAIPYQNILEHSNFNTNSYYAGIEQK